jgi:hypothetical protein
MRRGAAAALCLVLATAARARDPEANAREVLFPREGFSVRLTPDWAIEQYGDPPIAFASGEVRVGVTPAPPSEIEPREALALRLVGPPEERGPHAQRVVAAIAEWKPPGASAGALHRPGTGGTWRGILRRAAGGDLSIEVRGAREETATKAAQGILDSIDLGPFSNPRTHADWACGWTVEVPRGWRSVGDRGAARFESPDGGSLLGVDLWKDLPDPPAPDAAPEERARIAFAGALGEGLGGRRLTPLEEPEVAEVGLGAGIDGRLAGGKVRVEGRADGEPDGFAVVLTSDRYRLFLLSAAEGSPASRDGFDALRTFEPNLLKASRTAPPPAPSPRGGR